MQNKYYIQIEGAMDGPHDLVTIMRRVRAGKITPNTHIFSDAAAAPLPASFIPEIAAFFEKRAAPAVQSNKEEVLSVSPFILDGWHFTMEHNIMTVFAGTMFLLTVMMAIGLTSALGMLAGGISSWCIFLPLYYIYIIFVMRLYRGQSLGKEFLTHYFMPALPSLFSACVVLALFTCIGCVAAIAISLMLPSLSELTAQAIEVSSIFLPGTVIYTLFIFVPFIILDQRCSFWDAFVQSARMVTRPGRQFFSVVLSLVLLQLLCMLLIIPMPLTLPIFAAALSRLYEDISAA